MIIVSLPAATMLTLLGDRRFGRGSHIGCLEASSVQGLIARERSRRCPSSSASVVSAQLVDQIKRR